MLNHFIFYRELHQAISQGWTFFNWTIANEFQSTEEKTTKNMIVARLVGPKGFLFSDLIGTKKQKYPTIDKPLNNDRFQM